MKNIEIFCGVNSVGMPFTEDNKEHIGYYDIIVKQLRDRGFNVSGLNFSRLDKNHTWDLEDNLINDRSIAYLKELQLKSVDDLRNTNALFKLVVPKAYKSCIKIYPSDYDTTLRSMYINAENPIFIYSAGPNDFFSYIRSGPFELIHRSVREKLPKDIRPILEKCIGNIEKNWQLLQELNPNVRIYALNYFYSPLYARLSKIIYLQDRIAGRTKKYVDPYLKAIDLYNGLLLEACKKYDYVEYCDISFIKDFCARMDFHPGTKGNRLIAELILKKIETQVGQAL